MTLRWRWLLVQLLLGICILQACHGQPLADSEPPAAAAGVTCTMPQYDEGGAEPTTTVSSSGDLCTTPLASPSVNQQAVTAPCAAQNSRPSLVEDPQTAAIARATDTYSVLAVLMPWKSRMFSQLRILAELQSRGNNVTVLVPTALQQSASSYLRYTLQQDVLPSSLTFIPYAGAQLEGVAESRPGVFEGIRLIATRMGESCRNLMLAVKEANLRTKAEFKVLFADVLDKCRVNVADYMRIPRIDFDSSAGSLWFAFSEYNIKLPVAYVPSFQSNLTYDISQWNVLHRVKNFLVVNAMKQLVDYFFLPHILQVREQENITGSYTASQRQNILLTLVAADWCFQPVWNAPPLLKFVGPLLPHPPRPVPDVLEAFIQQGTPHGAVVVSFGTTFVPCLELHAVLMRALQQLPYQVIWKLTQHDQDRLAQHLNVTSLNEFKSKFNFLDWLEQNNIIGHPAVKGIITHGGINSLYETVWHGKPLVAVPLAADQNENAKWLEFEGVGRWLHESWWTDVNAGIVLELLKDVFGNPKYTQAAQAKSRCMRSHKNTAAERSCDWFDYAIANAPHKLFHSRDTQLSWAVSAGWDVFLLLTAAMLVVCYVVLGLVRWLVLKVARLVLGSGRRKAGSTVMGTASDGKDKVE